VVPFPGKWLGCRQRALPEGGAVSGDSLTSARVPLKIG
jgi:hypothetical protein